MSDWSSDVCSSDLFRHPRAPALLAGRNDHAAPVRQALAGTLAGELHLAAVRADRDEAGHAQLGRLLQDPVHLLAARDALRSDEHTSELQSLMRISYAVFCLTQKNNHTNTLQQYKSSPLNYPNSYI